MTNVAKSLLIKKSERSERKQTGLKSINSTMTSPMLFRTWIIKN